MTTLSQKIEETVSKYPEVDKDIIKLIVIDVVEFMKEQGREE